MMTDTYLVLVFDAPLISYGGVSVDRRRVTDLFPGRSMLTGLIGNALGYRRQDFDKLGRLQGRIRHAACTDFGEMLRDYHTARLDNSEKAWTTYGVPEGREGGKNTPYHTEIREVDYLADSLSVVAMTVSDMAEGPSLDDVAEAMLKPARPLFIGRKNCLPSRPIFEELLEASHETEVLYIVGARLGMSNPMIQWDGVGEHSSVRKEQDAWVSDLKDWENNMHVGGRLVSRGTQVNSGQEEI